MSISTYLTNELVPERRNHTESRTLVRAYASLGPGQPLEPWAYEPGPLGADDIDLSVTHCGVCHTDAHLVSNDFGLSTYPLVPGHEVIGTVTAVGSAVEGFSIGQRIGVGWQRGACNRCEWCQQGLQNLCAPRNPLLWQGMAASLIL